MFWQIFLLTVILVILVAGFFYVFKKADEYYYDPDSQKPREKFEYCECCGKKIRGTELHEYCCEGFGLCRKCYKLLTKKEN